MTPTFRFDLRLEDPSLDLYRIGWSPAPDVGFAGMWVSGVVTDADGQDYLGLRGWGDYVPGMTHTVAQFCGFRALVRSMTEMGEPLYREFSTHDWFEPFQHHGDERSATFTHDTGRVVRDDEGLHWVDADGRWELHGRTVSTPFLVHLPAQQGVADQVWYRHELVLATGQVNGVPVEGYLHQDFCYGEPGKTYTELPILRDIEGLWVSWIHELEDGSVGGGCLWKGRGDLDFNPGYLLKDGTTTTHGDIRTELVRGPDGLPSTLQVDIGGDRYVMALDTLGGPIHYLGRLASATTSSPVRRSWCFVENVEGLITPETVDVINARYDLARGR